MSGFPLPAAPLPSIVAFLYFRPGITGVTREPLTIKGS
jgi:hypothetical protein